MIDKRLKELKASFGGKMFPVNAYDANAARQTTLSQDVRPMYTNRLAVNYASRKIQIYVNEELACVSVLGNFDISPFTLNAEDRIGLQSIFAGPILIGAHEYAVFTKEGIITTSQRSILHLIEVSALIGCHNFRTGEALHFYRNGLILYLRKEDLSSQLILLMLAVADGIPSEDSGADRTELPPEFSHLERLTRDWAIGDDVERTDRIASASERKLRKVLAAVEPDLEAINAYLEKLVEHPPDEAVANLTNLIQMTLEIKAVLTLRTIYQP